MDAINLDKDVKIRDVNYYFRELFGVISPLNEDDANNRKELKKAKRRAEEDCSFEEFAISHYWNRCLVELNRKDG